jgi:hypothetical protein
VSDSGGSDERVREVRTAWIRLDPLPLDHELALQMVRTSEDSAWKLLIDTDEPDAWDAEIAVDVSGVRIDRLAARWRGGERWHQSRVGLQPADMLREVLAALDDTYDAGARDRVRRVSIGIELLTDRTQTALDDENSRLRAELAAARVEIDFLRRTIVALNEAKATGRKSIIGGALAFFGGIMFSVATGVAGGVAQGLTDAAIKDSAVEVH